MWEFRPARPEEAPAVLAFYETMIDAMADWPEKPGWKKGIYPTLDYLRACAQAGELYILTGEGAVLGALVMNNRWNETYDTVSWPVDAKPEEVRVIHTLCVDVTRHRRGLGRQMMDGCAEAARAVGCKALRLDVLVGNGPALAFYPNAGFSPIATVHGWYPDTDWDDFVMFERPL